MPRDKKVEILPDIDIDALPELTDKQLGFVNCLLEGDSGTEAYRKNYDVSNSTQQSVYVMASRVKGNPNVKIWLEYLKRHAFKRCIVTLEEHVAELEALKEESRKTGNYGAAVNAEVNRGKASGLYIERREDLTTDQMGLNELLDWIRELAEDQYPGVTEHISTAIGLKASPKGTEH